MSGAKASWEAVSPQNCGGIPACLFPLCVSSSLLTSCKTVPLSSLSQPSGARVTLPDSLLCPLLPLPGLFSQPWSLVFSGLNPCSICQDLLNSLAWREMELKRSFLLFLEQGMSTHRHFNSLNWADLSKPVVVDSNACRAKQETSLREVSWVKTIRMGGDCGRLECAWAFSVATQLQSL